MKKSKKCPVCLVDGADCLSPDVQQGISVGGHLIEYRPDVNGNGPEITIRRESGTAHFKGVHYAGKTRKKLGNIEYISVCLLKPKKKKQKRKNKRKKRERKK